MSEEDQAAMDLSKALTRVRQIPRPNIRHALLMDAMLWIAKELGVTVEKEK